MQKLCPEFVQGFTIACISPPIADYLWEAHKEKKVIDPDLLNQVSGKWGTVPLNMEPLFQLAWLTALVDLFSVILLVPYSFFH